MIKGRNRKQNVQLLDALSPGAGQTALRAAKLSTAMDGNTLTTVVLDGCCEPGDHRVTDTLPQQKGGVAIFDGCTGVVSYNMKVISKRTLKNYSQHAIISQDVILSYTKTDGSDEAFSPASTNFDSNLVDGLIFMFPATAGVALPGVIDVTVKGFTDKSNLNAGSEDYNETLQAILERNDALAWYSIAFRDSDGYHTSLRWNNDLDISGTVKILKREIKIGISGFPVASVKPNILPLNSDHPLALPVAKKFNMGYNGRGVS